MAAIGGWAGLPVVSVRRTRGLIGASPPALRARAKGLPAPPANNLCVSAPLREAGFFISRGDVESKLSLAATPRGWRPSVDGPDCRLSAS